MVSHLKVFQEETGKKLPKVPLTEQRREEICEVMKLYWTSKPMEEEDVYDNSALELLLRDPKWSIEGNQVLE